MLQNIVKPLIGPDLAASRADYGFRLAEQLRYGALGLNSLMAAA
jgi:hypothetical protein